MRFHFSKLWPYVFLLEASKIVVLGIPIRNFQFDGDNVASKSQTLWKWEHGEGIMVYSRTVCLLVEVLRFLAFLF